MRMLALFALTAALAAAQTPDVIIVGAGCAGLSAAHDAAKGGAQVAVLDIASVFGGHAVVSEGGLSFPNTPFQRQQGVDDSPDLMYEDTLRFGEDANKEWVRLYVDRSVEELYDWLVSLGVRFHLLGRPTGASVARFHRNPKRGFGVVEPVYRACLATGNVDFRWNHRVTRLIVEEGRVVGVEGRHERTGEPFSLRAPAVVLATGGFQSNVDLVRENWPPEMSKPPRLMVGSGVNAFGSGFELVTGIGGTTERLDHQWNYPRGIPDPRYPGTNRGLSLNRVVYPWVNEHGKRFVAELGSDTVLKALVQQPNSRAFLIFDDDGKLDFAVAGTDWADFSRIERLIFSNPDITIKANTIDELAVKTGMPPGDLNRTITRWNEMLEAGEDLDFGRFSKSEGTLGGTGRELPRAVLRAPFYAVAVYPITRKSMGGVVTDLQSRVLRGDGAPIPGLYAIGEVTGFNGFNGKAALEGTFIAPAMLQGRLVGRAIAAAVPQRPATNAQPQAPSNSSEQVIEAPCSTCHDIEKLLATHREGYWHFERVHQVVIENKYECVKCHAEMQPFRASQHKIDRVAQIENCASCHLGDVAGE